MMWARVKGKTENKILSMGFKQAYAFRPGGMIPTPGLKNTLSAYRYLAWLIPIFKILLPNSISTLAAVGKAMISVTLSGYQKKQIEVVDIKKIAGEG
jgi:hypothetical protein